MSMKKREMSVNRTGIGTGAVSMLVVFTILSFTTLALLTLSTALSNRRTNEKGTDALTNMAQAESIVYETIVEVDMVLLDVGGSSTDEETFYKTVYATLDPRTFDIDKTVNMVSFAVTIDDNNELFCELLILPPGSRQRYSIVSMSSRLTIEWAPEQDGEVWTGQ